MRKLSMLGVMVVSCFMQPMDDKSTIVATKKSPNKRQYASYAQAVRGGQKEVLYRTKLDEEKQQYLNNLMNIVQAIAHTSTIKKKTPSANNSLRRRRNAASSLHKDDIRRAIEECAKLTSEEKLSASEEKLLPYIATSAKLSGSRTLQRSTSAPNLVRVVHTLPTEKKDEEKLSLKISEQLHSAMQQPSMLHHEAVDEDIILVGQPTTVHNSSDAQLTVKSSPEQSRCSIN